MPNKALLIITIILATGFLDVALRLGISLIEPFLLITLILILVVLISLPFSIKEKESTNFSKKSIFGYPLIVGMFFASSAISYMLAMETVPLVLLAPVGASQIIIPVILSIIFLRERPTRFQYLGIPSVIFGVIILTNPSLGNPLETPLSLVSYFWMFTALITSGFMVYFSRLGIPIFGTNRFFTFSSLFALFVLLLILPSRFPISLDLGHLPYVVLAAVLLVVARHTLMRAMNTIPLSILMPMMSIYPIVPMVYGLLFLGEFISLIQGIGAALALTGIMMLNR